MARMVRREFNSNETITLRVKDMNDVQLFLGVCHGIVLHPRERNDRHICFTWIIKDDGHWSGDSGGSSSSYWIDDAIKVLAVVNKWLKKNARPDMPDTPGYAGKRQCGWRYKS